MTSPLTLQSAKLRCELHPDLGGCVAGLWFGEQQVLRSTPAAQLRDVRVSGSYPLLPYSNRIGWRKLHWAGQDYELPQNFGPEPHTIHGVGWERAWQVEAASATQAVLGYRQTAGASRPFAFDSRQTITLAGDAPKLQLSIAKRADLPVPTGLGWHPYFANSAATPIQFAVRGRWEVGADHLPTQRLPNPGLETDCSRLEVDHCFDGWSGGVHLAKGGLRVLQPGQTFVASMRIQV